MITIVYGKILEVKFRRERHELRPIFIVETNNKKKMELVCEVAVLPKDMEIGKKRSFVVEEAVRVITTYNPVIEPKTMNTSSIDITFTEGGGNTIQRNLEEKMVYLKTMKKEKYWKLTNLDLDIRSI